MKNFLVALSMVTSSLMIGITSTLSFAHAESVFNQSIPPSFIAPPPTIHTPSYVPYVHQPVIPFPQYGQRRNVSGFNTTYTPNGQVVIKLGQTNHVVRAYSHPTYGVPIAYGGGHRPQHFPQPFYRHQPLLAVLNDPTFRYGTQSLQEQMLHQLLQYGVTGDSVPLNQADVYDVEGFRRQVWQGILGSTPEPPHGVSFPKVWVEVNRFGEVTGLAVLRSSGSYTYDVAFLAGLGRALQRSLFPPTWRGNTLALYL
jgi:hypothetical protein